MNAKNKLSLSLKYNTIITLNYTIISLNNTIISLNFFHYIILIISEKGLEKEEASMFQVGSSIINIISMYIISQ